MTNFNCSNPLNIASTDYVDCVGTTVSGSLQNQLNSLINRQEVSLDFDGSTEFLANNTSQPLEIINRFTLMSWVKFRDTSVTERILKFNENSGPANNIRLSLVPLSTPPALRAGVFDKDSTTGTVAFKEIGMDVPEVGKWLQIIVTWDGAELSLFKNANKVNNPHVFANDPVELIDSPRNIIIADLFGSERFNGWIHSVAFWDKVLNENEIISIFNNGDGAVDLRLPHNNYTSTGSLKHYWRLGYSYDDIAKDLGFTGNPRNLGLDASGLDANDISIHNFPI